MKGSGRVRERAGERVGKNEKVRKNETQWERER